MTWRALCTRPQVQSQMSEAATVAQAAALTAQQSELEGAAAAHLAASLEAQAAETAARAAEDLARALAAASGRAWQIDRHS